MALGFKEKVGMDEAVRILSRGGGVQAGGPGVLGRQACESEEPPTDSLQGSLRMGSVSGV